MMTMGRGIALALVLLTSACGDADPPPANETAAAKASRPNPFHERLTALNETDRGLTLRRAVQDNGGSCPRFLTSGFQEDYQGLKMWTLRCEGNRDWAIFVGASGRVQTRTCADNAKLGLPACRFPEAAGN
ncbi:hypothetical protein IC614_11245 [Allosphingosinicella flava]|uniref:Uncharacterized protein n=1 Tax=Allosphingosinicella flava TaxID=2771430 RepID=A0A7T2LMB4_9SPHN|nr:hypothetical protein [Sphingosinicella flava]QPQ54877.1 hypothetical protein IC614_11245 [Sphingosinicella flava]